MNAAQTVFGLGAATSTDGINWVKSAANPIIPTGIGNVSFLKVSNTAYYMYGGFVSPVSEFAQNA